MQNPVAFIKKLLKKGYRKAMRSIAFYPVIVSLSLFSLAIITLNLENWNFVIDIKKSNPYLFIEDTETARTILSTLIAGIITLTVFSFTMVMVVLNQAASNFSPRLLPGLVSNKRHQLILGFYIGTLLYSTVILISLGAYDLENNTVGMSTTLAAVLGISCVGLFVSFIHNISSAVQIQNIVESIYRRSKDTLEHYFQKELTEITPLKFVGDDDYKLIASNKEGYFQGFDIHLLDAAIFNTDLQLVVVPYTCEHIWNGSPLFKTSRSLTKEEEAALLFACIVSKDLHDGNHPLLGLIKLMEIGVRAMSPGINDPGTALDVVHKLGPLLAQMIRLPAYTSNYDMKRSLVVVKTNISTSMLLSTIVQPIRLYAKKDSSLMTALIKTFDYLKLSHGISEEDKEAIAQEQIALEEDIAKFITNKKDKQRILGLLADLG